MTSGNLGRMTIQMRKNLHGVSNANSGMLVAAVAVRVLYLGIGNKMKTMIIINPITSQLYILFQENGPGPDSFILAFNP